MSLNFMRETVLKRGNPPKEMEAGLLSIKDTLREAVARKKVPGAAFLLAYKSQIIFEEYAGVADITTGRPFDGNTIKLLASSSKPVSVSVILTLVDEGIISLDDPISKYLPEHREFKVRNTNEKVPAPTLGQCLSMTSGIFGLMQATPKQHHLQRDPDLSLAESARLILKEDLATRPGTYFSYSNASFQVAGYIAELLTGKNFEELVQERICRPLEMQESMFINQMRNNDQWERLDAIHLPDGKGNFDIAVRMDRNHVPRLTLLGGSMVGTCRDYLAFLQMHLNGGSYGQEKILSRALADEMRRVRTAGLERDILGVPVEDYCMGWFALRTGNDGLASAYRHGGQWGTSGWIDHDRDLAAFWATNVPSSSASAILEKIFNTVQDIIPGPRTHYIKQAPIPKEAGEAPVISEFNIEPVQIRPGEKVTVSWLVTGFNIRAYIEPEIGNLNSFMIGTFQNKGLLQISPKNSTTYTLVASNSIGEETRSASVLVI